MIIGLKSLQRFYQLRELIYFAYKNLDVVLAKSIFFETVEAVRNLEAKDPTQANNAHKYLMEQTMSRYDFGEASPHYLVLRDIIAKFEDYFNYFLNDEK